MRESEKGEEKREKKTDGLVNRLLRPHWILLVQNTRQQALNWNKQQMMLAAKPPPSHITLLTKNARDLGEAQRAKGLGDRCYGVL